MWPAGQGGAWSSGRVCGVGLTAGLCPGGHAPLAARGVVDGGVCGAVGQVPGPPSSDLYHQTAMGRRHAPGDRARGAAPLEVCCGGWPLGEEPGFSGRGGCLCRHDDVRRPALGDALLAPTPLHGGHVLPLYRGGPLQAGGRRRHPCSWLRGVRWAGEQGCEAGKTELGMAHYAVRQYPGWHHHILMTMLAHCFLWHLKLRLGKKSARADGIAAAEALGGRLAPTDVYHSRGVGVGGLGTAPQSSCLSVP